MSGKRLIMVLFAGVLVTAAVTLTLYFLTRQDEPEETGPPPPFALLRLDLDEAPPLLLDFPLAPA